MEKETESESGEEEYEWSFEFFLLFVLSEWNKKVIQPS